jgi:antitoxin component HigA of HigAB toxin-antitoxin module
MGAGDEREANLRRIIESAEQLGVEMDDEEALQWLTAMAAMQSGVGGDVTVDDEVGVYGHTVTMLDFSPQRLARFRAIGKLVEFEDEPGVVETALALSGSAAQSKIQSYPGDADYFERVNIIAPTREAACQILGRIMREKALSTLTGGMYQLIEVKLGSYPSDFVRDGERHTAGTPIAWTGADIEAGEIVGAGPDGAPMTITWEAAAQDPGWCKLDWVIADPIEGTLGNASNMLDVTWEAPDGTITPLDGYLDPYFQEVYLQAESIPLFSKLADHVSADALVDYVRSLEKEVHKYVSGDPVNYGKAAKRMYNIFRLNGAYEEAAFLRELFDEPATLLYQIHSLIRTIDDAALPGSSISLSQILAHTDRLILQVIDALEGEQEVEIVRLLLRLRDTLSRHGDRDGLSREAEAARDQVINIVNNFFYEKLTAMPTIKAYIEEQAAS